MKLKHTILIISFIEGATVMAIEIGSSKLLSPVFGSSLYVWSSVLAITLLGLACGYFIGGKLSEKEHLQLVAFLKSLTDTSYLRRFKFMDKEAIGF